jgi:hypothetical protein
MTMKRKNLYSGSRKKRVYVSGPMTGFPDLNYPAFHAKATRIRKMGYLVTNPAEHFNGRKDLDRETYLKNDIRELVRCDYITFLEGWESSKGAVLEYLVSLECGIKVLKEDYCERCNCKRLG